jgi:peptidyl-prolyl cis-trans isomerase C
MIMMKPRHAILAGLTWAFVSASLLSGATADPAAPPATAAAPKVLATVNGKNITEEDLKIATEDLGSSVPQQLQGKARETYLVDSQLVVQKAMAEKLDQTPGFTEKLSYMHDKALMEILLSDVAKAATTDEMLHKTYDDAAKAQKPETEVHARHILVPTEAEAQAALKRVKAGEDFAKVAKEVSKDPSAEGGDLGWFTKDRMVPEFAEAAFKLEPGQISDPVKSQFGWHIIKLEGKRQKSFPPFDEVRDQIVRYVVQKAQSELIVKLRDSAKIERAEPETPPGDTAAPAASNEPPASKPANPAGK